MCYENSQELPEYDIDGVETRRSCSYEVVSLIKVCITGKVHPCTGTEVR